GRSFWILDDVTPLRQFDPSTLAGPAYLFTPRPTVRFKTYPGFGSEVPNTVSYRWAGPIVYAAWVTERPTGVKEVRPLDAGENPPDGAILTYYLAAEPAEVTLTILDAEGRELRRFSSEKPVDPYPDLPEGKKPSLPPRLDKTPGFHRFIWDLRVEGARRAIGDKPYEAYLVGPRVVPGTYQVRLTVGDHSWTQPLEIRPDPRLPVTREDLERQFDLLLRIRDKVSEAHDAINRLRDARHQLDEWQRRLEVSNGTEELLESIRAMRDRLGSLIDELLEPRMDDPRQFPWRAPARLAALQSFVDSADDRPTAAEEAVYRELTAEIDAILARVRQALEEELPALGHRLLAAGVSPILPRPVLARP
ncbi:MAG: glycosyl hydrolase, partial [Thermomicrobium sp.]